MIWRILAALLGIVIVPLFLWVIYMEGRGRFIDHLVVRGGAPFYRGSYYGKCAEVFDSDGTVKEQFCATDDRE